MSSGLSCSPLHVQDGETAFYIASRFGHDQIVELLLGREADVNIQTKVRPLMLVCVCVCSSTAMLYILRMVKMALNLLFVTRKYARILH